MGLIPGPVQWIKDLVTAAAPIQSPAWEIPYAAGAAIKKERKKRNKKNLL